MARRFKFAGPRREHYLRQWREHAGLTLDQMVVAIAALPGVDGGLSKSSLSRIETGDTPYTRDTIEAYAQVLGRSPAELLARPPTDPEEIWLLWERLLARLKNDP